MLLHYLTKHGNTKIASFHSNVVLLLFQLSTNRCLILFQCCTWNSYSRCCRLPRSCNKLSLALACWDHSSGEMNLRVSRSSCWTVLRAPCTGACMSCVAERQIMLSLTTCSITANICWDSKISHQHCPLNFHFRLDKEQLPTSDTATDITTDLVNDECVVTDGSTL